MVLAAMETRSDRFRIFFMSELLMIFTLPPTSIRQVVRMPISQTVPRKPFTSTMSPTLYWFSKSMNIPVITSAIRLSALKPTTRVNTPTLARMPVTFTPRMYRPQQRMTMAATYFPKLAKTVTSVWAR